MEVTGMVWMERKVTSSVAVMETKRYPKKVLRGQNDTKPLSLAKV